MNYLSEPISTNSHALNFGAFTPTWGHLIVIALSLASLQVFVADRMGKGAASFSVGKAWKGLPVAILISCGSLLLSLVISLFASYIVMAAIAMVAGWFVELEPWPRMRIVGTWCGFVLGVLIAYHLLHTVRRIQED